MRHLLQVFKKRSENVRMVLVAVLGALIGFVTYEIIYYFNPIIPKATSSWFLAFIIGVIRQHTLHRWLTFNHKTHYWRSLFRAYVMYSGSLLIGSGLNWILTEILLLHHRLAWGSCLIVTASMSLFLLKKYVFKSQ